MAVLTSRLRSWTAASATEVLRSSSIPASNSSSARAAMERNSGFEPASARADLGLPRRLVRLFSRLPQSEVARVLLLVLVRVNALAAAQTVSGEVYLRELAVLWERADAVVVRAVGLVCVAPGFEPLDDVNHLFDVSRRARRHFGPLGPERVEVFEEGFGELRRVLVNALPLCARELDDAVFDVRDVHHVPDLEALVLEIAAQNVGEGGHRSEVADVRVVP